MPRVIAVGSGAECIEQRVDSDVIVESLGATAHILRVQLAAVPAPTKLLACDAGREEAGHWINHELPIFRQEMLNCLAPSAIDQASEKGRCTAPSDVAPASACIPPRQPKGTSLPGSSA